MPKTIQIVATCAISLMMANSVHAAANEPGWTPRVIKVGEDREVSDRTPMVDRPYRPLHFYGNTVRRVYYRGRALPNAQDVRTTARLLIQR